LQISGETRSFKQRQFEDHIEKLGLYIEINETNREIHHEFKHSYSMQSRKKATD
jgi:hypothetical protein